MIYALYFVNHDLFPPKYIFSYLSTYHFQSLSGVVHLEDDTGRNKKMIKSCSKKKRLMRLDPHLGQMQKLIKKSTIGDPGMWRRCRTLIANDTFSSVSPERTPECVTLTQLLWKWCRWPKLGTSSPQPEVYMSEKEAGNGNLQWQQKHSNLATTPIWPTWKAMNRRARSTEATVTGTERGLPPSLVAIRYIGSGKLMRPWVVRSW